MNKDRFQQRRSAHGYQAPYERDRCGNCRHRSVQSMSLQGAGHAALHCKLGGFFVAPGGICRDHQLAGIASVPRIHDKEQT